MRISFQTRGWWIALARGSLAAASVSGAASAAAQSAPAGTALGLRAGGFFILPQVRATVSYNDNIFLRQQNVVGDGISVVIPEVTVQSNWNRHELDLHAIFTDTRYFEHADQSNDQYSVSGNGRLDIYDDLVVNASGSYGHLVEQRGTPGNDFIAGSPVRYTLAIESGQITKTFNRLSLAVGGKFRRYSYRDVKLPTGLVLDQTYRDHRNRDISGQIGYAYSAITTLYVSGNFSRATYHPKPGFVDRTNHGFSVLAGANFELTRLLHGGIGFGYISQEFRDPRQRPFSGFDYSANVTYQPTALTRVVLSADRTLTDSAIAAVGAVLTSSVRLGVTHELLRTLILETRVDYSRDTYSLIEQSRTRLTGEFSARRRFNDYLSATAAVSHSAQTSSGGRRYHGNVISVGLVASR